MKKFFALLVAMMMVFGMFSAAMADDAPAYKIAIMTGTTSQGEEEYYAATSLAEKYPDIVIHDTYPDNFSSEVETTISKLIAFGSDPEVKAIIEQAQGHVVALTEVERNILRMICDGMTNPQIAGILNLSTETINWYRKRLLSKFGVKNAVSLATLVLREKII